MQLRLIVFLVFIQTSSSFSQISPIRYHENFDGDSAPTLPSGWSGIGFVTYASSPRSSPNCVSATGNRSQKTLLSPVFNFGSHLPDKLLFWERRTSTAAAYRLEIRASIDGINFGSMLAKYDTIAAISSYVQRVVDISNMGLNYQSLVQFQWILLADSVNNTGVLRIDDVSLSVATGFDIGISEIALATLQAVRKTPITLSAFVKNFGVFASSDFSVRFLCDENAHDPAVSLEQFSVLNGLSLAMSESLLCRITYTPLKGGEHHFAALVDYPSDENPSNDTAYATVHIGNVQRDLLINEIMYDPIHDQNEWFELINWSDQPVDLAHWTFHDTPTLNSVNSFEISTQSFVVKCGGYAIVAADSSIFKLYPDLSQSDSTVPVRVINRSSGFSFNNDGDAVVLNDITGQSIDSVAYVPRWHHPDVVDTKGRSLERINPNVDSNDPRGWSTCTNILGGTPGKANSIVTMSKKRNSLISVSPNPFSPDGDGFEDFCLIRYTLPVITSTMNIRIYDIKGRLVRALASGELAGPQGEIVWDGNDDNKQRSRIGMYVIFLEATDKSSGTVTTAKAVAVVAAKL